MSNDGCRGGSADTGNCSLGSRASPSPASLCAGQRRSHPASSEPACGLETSPGEYPVPCLAGADAQVLEQRFHAGDSGAQLACHLEAVTGSALFGEQSKVGRKLLQGCGL